jgi:hypothetical protein
VEEEEEDDDDDEEKKERVKENKKGNIRCDSELVIVLTGQRPCH